MAVYIQKKGDDGSHYGQPWIDKETGALCPESLSVAVTKLSVTDIVLINEWNAGIKRSAVITAIEKHPAQTYSKKWKITTVDGVGKVDVFETGNGRVWQFERQCSQEAKENVEERSRNIGLRRDIQRLERAVHRMLDEVTWLVKNGSKNPKTPEYQHQIASFALTLDSMYDDLGKDLGLPPRAKKKKKK